MTTELENFLSSKNNLTEISIKNYQNAYKRIKQFLSTDITKSDEERLIDVINMIDNVNSKLVVLNVMLLIKSHSEQSVNKLEKLREKLFEEKMKIGKQKLQEKNLNLPSYQVIDAFIKTLDTNQNYSEYIINYLTFYYGLRSKDVNLFVTTRKLTKNINTENNYLIVKKTEIEIIINDFKTIKQYLQKRIVIRNKNFVQICHILPLSIYILSGNKNPINESSLHNIITKMFYKHDGKHLTEGDYFKIRIRDLQSKPNSLQEIKKLGEYRGTSLDTIVQYYNLSIN
jgi:hypothetical protein